MEENRSSAILLVLVLLFSVYQISLSVGVEEQDPKNQQLSKSDYEFDLFQKELVKSSSSEMITSGRSQNLGDWSWSLSAGGLESDAGEDIATDDFGNTYVTGYYWQTGEFGDYTLGNTSAASDPFLFVGKIDEMGNWIWVKNAIGNARGEAVSVSQDGVLVTGTYSSDLYFDSLLLEEFSPNGGEIYVAKLDFNGTWLWAKAAGVNLDGGDSWPSLSVESLSSDTLGNSYITGNVRSDSAAFGAITLSTYGDSGSGSNSLHDSGYVAKIDTNGTWIWARNALGSCEMFDIDVGATDQIYVTGRSNQHCVFGNGVAIIPDNQESSQLLLAKIDDEGNWLWATSDGKGDGPDSGYSLAIDGQNDILVTGYFTKNSSFGSGENLTNFTSSGSADLFVAKYSGDSGEMIWVNTAIGYREGGWASVDEEYGRGIGTDSNGNVFVTGYFEGSSVEFGSISLSNSGSNYVSTNVFLSILDNGGNWISAIRTGESSSRALNLAINSSGFAYVTGYYVAETNSLSHSNIFVSAYSPDTDQDSILDLYDICPNTTPGFTSDENGCSASQRDTDEDGLVDSLDQCPGTETGIEVDDVGCWWGQFDTDGDGVQNSEDTCPKSNSNSCEIPSEWHLSERSIVLRQCTQEQTLTCKEESSLTENYDPQFNAISEIKFSSDGLLFATILNRDSVMIFDSQSKNQIAKINISRAHSISFSNEGTILAIGGDANISLWSTSNWQQIGLIGEEGGANINKISFSPDDKFLAYANTYPYVTRVIDLTDNSGGEGLFCHSRCAIVHNFTSPYNRIYSMDFSPDGSHFAISTQVDILGEFDVGLIVFETTNWSIEFTDAYGQITDPPEGHSQGYDNIRDLQFSTDNEWLITGSMRGDIRIYERSDWSVTGTFEIGMYGLQGIEISPDNSHIISSTTYRSGPPVVVLELINGNTESYNSPCGYGIGSTGEIWSLAISNDGSEMIMGGVTCLNEDSNILTNSVFVFEGDSDEDGVVESFDICPYTELTDSVNSQGCSANQVDSDVDGVYDSQDLCSDTASGVQVDQNGCASNQIDSDADGISDASDQCPNTPNGESVGLNGCSSSQLDSDDDGINDSEDICGDTSIGMEVDNSGCADNQLDGDADGISDSTDLCPNTPNEETVSSAGCSSSQLDTDMDGVLDSQDDCPSTPLETTVDSTGCAPDDVVDLDSDGDGVRDSIDACPNSAIGIVVDSTGCETSGDVQIAEEKVQSEDFEDIVDFFFGCCCFMVLIGIVAGIVSVIKYFDDSDIDEWSDYEIGLVLGTNQQSESENLSESSFEMEGVMAELERQRMHSELEIERLKVQQLAQQSNAAEMAAMQNEMLALQLKITESEQAKLQLQQEVENVKLQQQESTVQMQDSAMSGDIVTSGGQKVENMTNVVGTDPETIAKIIFEAQEKVKKKKRGPPPKSSLKFVERWEDLPDGEWLENDEHGVHWYLAEDGTHWRSTDGGYEVYNE